MCIPYRQLDLKARRQMVIGNLALAVGLVLINCTHPSSQSAQYLTQGVGGLLLGISIGVNLCACRCRSRQNA
jgi:uncharacterized membrane protein SirB2